MDFASFASIHTKPTDHIVTAEGLFLDTAQSGTLDARPCLCCNKALLGPVDRVHSFCDRACWVAYWAGSYAWLNAPNEIRVWAHSDLSRNEIRGRFCHMRDEEADTFEAGGLEAYAELARWTPDVVRYY